MRDYAMIYGALCEDLRPFVRQRGPRGFAVRAQLRNFYKKLSPDRKVSKSAELAAFNKFKAVNDAIADTYEWVSETEADERFWTLLKRYVRESTDVSLWDEDIQNLDVTSMSKWMGIGPGASLKSKSESFYTKLFDGDLVGTSGFLLARYRAAICDTGPWCDAEKARSERFGISIVEGNKLFFVAKTTEIGRSCCTEPILNMLHQKSIGEFLEHRLMRFFGISLETQPDFNRALCLEGSRNGAFGTIDLQSASDSISWSLVQQLFPAYLNGWFSTSRSPLSIAPNGESIRLKMISTMGNGFTFPLETLLFAAVVRVVYHFHGLPCRCPRTQFGVFGDDIIVARECYDDVVRYLTKLGFRVNVSKSFNTGPFRESCGRDYYEGVPVRPVFIRSLETPSDVYSAINRLTRWSARQRIPLTHTIGKLLGWVRLRPVPPSESDDAGVKMPFFMASEHGVTHSSYRILKRVPRRRKVAESPSEAVELGYRAFNPDGWFTTMLGGYARSRVSTDQKVGHMAYLGLRDPPDQRGRYNVVKASIPWWDWPGPHADRVSHSAWEWAMAGYSVR